MADETQAPDRVLPYRRLDLIGVGASSEVYRAVDPELDRVVAVKVQLVDASDSERQAFASEARATARLEHPNVVPVYALGKYDDDRLCIAMQELRGQTLTEFVEGAAHWPSRAYFTRVVTTILRVADALRFAHDLGYVHRDVKPDNVLVGAHGETYLLDWGLARQPRSSSFDGRPSTSASETGSGTIIGTPRFMAPEQAEGDAEGVDARTDVFGLGATLYFALTRRAPFDAASLGDAVESARNCLFVDPSAVHPTVALPSDLCAIVRRAMSMRSEDRYPTILAMSADLERYLHAGDRVALKRFEAGARIVSEGDEAHEAFRILSGSCAVTRQVRGQQVKIRSMSAGEPFGETAIFGSSTRSATVTAETDVLVEVMSRTDVEAWLDGDGWIAPFVRALASRFVNVEQARDTADLDAAAWRAATQILLANGRDPERTWPSLCDELCASGDLSADVVHEGLTRTGLRVVDDRLLPSR